jgi:hypothetical protein
MARTNIFFCQTPLGPNHKSVYCRTLEEANDWLVQHGDDAVKHATVAIVSQLGNGLGLFEFEAPLRTWGIIGGVPPPQASWSSRMLKN